jgi:tetratricopeptide (TPR) repeat protein
MGKISRNSICPCGSGKKYKKCCMNNIATKAYEFPAQLNFINNNTDKNILNILQDLKNDNSYLISPEWWHDLGAAISKTGDHKKALIALKKAYKLSNNDPVHLLNIAANMSMQGDAKAALKIIKKLPKNIPRKSVITGNILQELGRYKESIAFYESAIKEESDFELTYTNLLYSLKKVDSLSLEYWFEKTLNKFPNNSSVIYQYCEYLFEINNIDRLSEYTNKLNLKDLEKEDRPEVFSKSNDLQVVNTIEVYKAIGELSNDTNLDNLTKTVKLLNKDTVPDQICNKAKYLANLSAINGSVINVEESYKHICEECKSEFLGMIGDINTYRAKAYEISGEPKKALKAAKESLKTLPKNSNNLHAAWWCADDLGKNQESLEFAKLLYEIQPDWENSAYNLALLYGKNGDVALAKHYYEVAIEDDVKNWRAFENLALLYLLDAKFDEAEKVWDKYIEIYKKESDYIEDAVHFSYAYSADVNINININIINDNKQISFYNQSDTLNTFQINYEITDHIKKEFNSVTINWNIGIEDEDALIFDINQAYTQPSVGIKNKQNKWTNLVLFADKTQGSLSYSLDIISENKKTDPMIGSDHTVKRKAFNNNDLISAISEPDSTFKKEVLHHLEMNKRGDMSEIISELITEVPIWKSMPNEAKIAILEGDNTISSGSSLDYAPVIVTIVKSVEITLKKMLFDKFLSKCRLNLNIEESISIGRQTKFKQAHNFITFIEKGKYLELGAMNHIFNLCNGKTANKLSLLQDLKDFIYKDLKWNDLLLKQTIDDISFLSSMRNPAAHSNTYNKDNAIQIRSAAVRVLSNLTAYGP